MINAQVDGTSKQLATVGMQSMDDTIARNYAIGVLSGMKQAIGMPNNLIAACQAEYEQKLEEYRNDV